MMELYTNWHTILFALQFKARYDLLVVQVSEIVKHGSVLVFDGLSLRRKLFLVDKPKSCVTFDHLRCTAFTLNEDFAEYVYCRLRHSFRVEGAAFV